MSRVSEPSKVPSKPFKAAELVLPVALGLMSSLWVLKTAF